MPQPPSPGGRGRIEPGRPRHHVDDGAAAALEHDGNTAWISRTWCMKLPVNTFEHRLRREVGDPVEGADALVDRVVEQHVDAAPLLEHRGRQRDHRVAVEQVHRHDQRALTALLDLLGGALEAARHGTACRSSRDRLGLRAPSPSLTVRALTTTSKPASASASAPARPIPRLAPVTTATGAFPMVLQSTSVHAGARIFGSAGHRMAGSHIRAREGHHRSVSRSASLMLRRARATSRPPYLSPAVS